jgi:hypothetical protein
MTEDCDWATPVGAAAVLEMLGAPVARLEFTVLGGSGGNDHRCCHWCIQTRRGRHYGWTGSCCHCTGLLHGRLGGRLRLSGRRIGGKHG